MFKKAILVVSCIFIANNSLFAFQIDEDKKAFNMLVSSPSILVKIANRSKRLDELRALAIRMLSDAYQKISKYSNKIFSPVVVTKIGKELWKKMPESYKTGKDKNMIKNIDNAFNYAAFEFNSRMLLVPQNDLVELNNTLAILNNNYQKVIQAMTVLKGPLDNLPKAITLQELKNYAAKIK